MLDAVWQGGNEQSYESGEVEASKEDYGPVFAQILIGNNGAQDWCQILRELITTTMAGMTYTPGHEEVGQGGSAALSKTLKCQRMSPDQSRLTQSPWIRRIVVPVGYVVLERARQPIVRKPLAHLHERDQKRAPRQRVRDAAQRRQVILRRLAVVVAVLQLQHAVRLLRGATPRLARDEANGPVPDSVSPAGRGCGAGYLSSKGRRASSNSASPDCSSWAYAQPAEGAFELVAAAIGHSSGCIKVLRPWDRVLWILTRQRTNLGGQPRLARSG